MAFSVFGALTFGAGMAASAAEIPRFPGKFPANVALTSEYYFRGLSQTDDAPAIQGGFDYELDVAKPTTLYLGVWGSNVDFNEPGSVDGATVEIDLYGGLKGKVGRSGLSWDGGFIYYAYPGAASGLNYDYWEVQAAVGFDFGIAAVTGSINYTADNLGNSGEAVYSKLAVEVPVPGVKGLLLTGHMAEQYIEKDAAFGTSDYIEWNLGAAYNVAGLFDVSINYSDTDISPDIEGKDEAIIFTVGRKF
jgi:uncharacterized protein (TIGR02001 family)